MDPELREHSILEKRPIMMRLSRLFPQVAVLTHRPFLVLWASQSISVVGDSLHQIAAIWLVYEMTGSALSMGALVIAQVLPVILLSLLAGTFVDRHSRKRTMIVSDFLRAAVVASIPLLYLSGDLTVTHVLVVSFVHSVLSQFFGPAQTALVPQLVGEHELVAANAMGSISSRIARILGPAMGGVASAAIGPANVLWLDALTFIVSGMAIMTIPESRRAVGLDKPGAGLVRGVLTDLSEGIQFVASVPAIRVIAMIALLANLAFAPVPVVVPVFVREAYGSGVAAYGVLMSTLSLGMLAGAVAVGQFGDRLPKGLTISTSIALSGLSFALFAVSTTLPRGIAFHFIEGFFNMFANVTSVAVLQERTPNGLRGRVFGAFMLANASPQPISLGVAGLLVDTIGSRAVLVTCGLLTILTGLATFGSREFRRT